MRFLMSYKTKQNLQPMAMYNLKLINMRKIDIIWTWILKCYKSSVNKKEIQFEKTRYYRDVPLRNVTSHLPG